jgi:Pyridoxamine 5'-phosphate oxidase
VGHTERDDLITLVQAGRLMQVATLDAAGQPHLCHVWYAASFDPDRLLYISRPTRLHSANVRADTRVGGAIVTDIPPALGATARGVTFTGTATELATTGIDDQLRTFLNRWPQAGGHVNADALADGTAPSRLYEITVTSWVLFDEDSYSDQPRRPLAAHQQ